MSILCHIFQKVQNIIIILLYFQFLWNCLTIAFAFFANYNDTLYWMPCWKINVPEGTTESWPCSCSFSCSIIIGNRLKETCQSVIVCVQESTEGCSNEEKSRYYTCFSWYRFYFWVKWQACFLYINNNHMKEHTRHGYMDMKAVFVITMCLVQDVYNDSCVYLKRSVLIICSENEHNLR